MQRSPAHLARIVVVLAALGVLVAAAGCKDDEGTTPTCQTDQTENGLATDDAGAHVDGGCNPFPTCRDDQGNVLPAASCCIGPDAGKNAEPTDDQRQCLCAYGVRNDCTNFGSGGSGTTTTTTTSTGATTTTTTTSTSTGAGGSATTSTAAGGNGAGGNGAGGK